MLRFRERRFNRKVRKREQYLRMMANRAQSLPILEEAVITPSEPHHGPWECTFCRREFFSFPALLNHKCDDG